MVLSKSASFFFSQIFPDYSHQNIKREVSGTLSFLRYVSVAGSSFTQSFRLDVGDVVVFNVIKTLQGRN